MVHCLENLFSGGKLVKCRADKICDKSVMDPADDMGRPAFPLLALSELMVFVSTWNVVVDVFR